MRFAPVAFAFCLGASSAAYADPFVKLSDAYRQHDPAAASAAYAPDAMVIYRYDGAPEERYAGSKAITSSFKQLFDRIDPREQVDLNFRLTSRSPTSGEGFYRLRIGRNAPQYGRFSVTFDRDGRFASDTSTSATMADFEEAKGPVLVRPEDETIERDYYAKLTGRYRLPDGCTLIVTRSAVRLFVRNSCSNEWRGLNRLSGREWTAGHRVRSDKIIRTYRFTGAEHISSLEVLEGGVRNTAARFDTYRTEDVSFQSSDGTELRGTVYVPASQNSPLKKHAASVLIHGSGPQDRDGYASIIAVIADELAANGRVVLAYDKRGSGRSLGNGDRAGFDTLADDAISGMRALAQRNDVAKGKIGLAGSSQAGWVAARAIQKTSKVADVILLGAAGTAMSVIEQNLYNTEVRMRCAGIKSSDVTLALNQQRAFFAFLADPTKAAKLDALTIQGQARPELADWLFPNSAATDRSGGQWFTVLEPNYNPRPVWRAFKGRKLFLYGELDDSTPTALAIKKAAQDGAQVQQLKGAQHLGLLAADTCRAEVTDLNGFSPELFLAIASFAKSAG